MSFAKVVIKTDMRRAIFLTLFSTIFVVLFVFANSCKRPVPPKAIVHVVDEQNQPVEGAMVIIKAAPSDSSHTMVYLKDTTKAIADTNYTDDAGIVSYEFKFESIYKVQVTKEADRNHNVRRGIDVLVLQNDKTVETTIVINEQTRFDK